ncbi:Crp/Fnr family transcriptional regulator [Ruegeria sediminis]|uniref:Crp/Fnr family transcriptional regulator n=1 Tax=Ruegeria sediminis TaxID=2583820 RepID=A0ABY2X5W4_9RHOB|nr:Crp/Fnr family transcriptional regulator [Ruegeria sediminis]TMV10330.1 Crp/Fnr family transcriptional regulator [Ruegeria sediminis]
MGSFTNDWKKCKNCPIRHRAFCSRCEPDEFAKLESLKYYRTYNAGQTVVWAGDKMNFVASVVTGTATLRETLIDGRTLMVGLLLPADFLGRPGRSISPYEVTANTDLVLCCFRRNAFEKMMEEMPHIGRRLLEMSLDELDAAREWMLILGRKSAREKIASLLVALAQRKKALHQIGPNDRLNFHLPLTRESVADYLGLTLETVCRQISALKRDRLIEIEGKRDIIVPDLTALIREAGDDVGSYPSI